MDTIIGASTPSRGNQDTTIVYTSSAYGGLCVVGQGTTTGDYFSNGSTFDNSGSLQTLDFNQTGSGDTIALSVSGIAANLNLTNKGSLIGSTAWAGMTSGSAPISSLESEVGTNTGQGALVNLGSGVSNVSLAGGTGLTIVTGFNDASDNLTIHLGAGDTIGPASWAGYTDSSGLFAEGIFGSNGGGVVLVNPIGGARVYDQFAYNAPSGTTPGYLMLLHLPF